MRYEHKYQDILYTEIIFSHTGLAKLLEHIQNVSPTIFLYSHILDLEMALF